MTASVLAFIKRHWIAYLIGAVVALAAGLGAAYVVGQIGSTPASLREQQVAAEGDEAAAVADADGMNTLDGDAPEGTAAADTTLQDTATDTATTE